VRRTLCMFHVLQPAKTCTDLLPWLQTPGLKPGFKPKFETKVNLSFGLKPELAFRLSFGLKL